MTLDRWGPSLAGIVGWAFLLAACLSLFTTDAPASDTLHKPATIPLRFTPVQIKTLKRAQPNPSWKRAKTVNIEIMPGKQAAIHLYVDPATQLDGEMGEVHTFLEDHSRFYEIHGLGDRPWKRLQVRMVEDFAGQTAEALPILAACPVKPEQIRA